MELQKFSYDNTIVKKFLIATVAWGIIGMLVGLIAACQLAFPDFFNEYLGFKYISFGRIRPLHTNAVIFAFVGNAIFAGVYYSLQRLLKARMWSDKLSNINFWGWQLIILSAVITLPMGFTSSKEYAELEWPIDIAITLIWVVFGWNMFATILKRRVKHLYVAIWFYIATFVTVAVLHIFNSFALPVSFMKSYSWYAGVQDALVQWWYGHNAVAFFLTTPFLGLMYYYVPKAANRPVYSYRLSIIHFWSLIFIYIWAGPHHLLYTSLPDWAQSLGVAFSIMLIAPSWGGMLNGLLTLRGVWDKVREDAVLKFFVVALTCYGMATFEGPMLSLKSVNVISHFTDWTIAHVHIGGLGWNGMLAFGMLYWMVPKMWGTQLHSKKMANAHFWIATLGIIVYALPIYWAGFMQGLMWQDFNPDGTLVHGDFMETATQLKNLYITRVLGGILYIVGAFMMVFNLIKTAKKGSFIANESAEALPLGKKTNAHKGDHWHRVIERKPVRLLVLSLVVILIGGLIEIVPTMLVKSNVPTISSVQPYTPLELEGRDIYIREGCNNCHSQMVRPLRFETARYGEYSKVGEFVYDHPFLWGSKRTGPDLHREGIGNKNNRPDSWHYRHFKMPSNVSDGSLMPAYSWLIEDELDYSDIAKKISVMRELGVPYPEGYEKIAEDEIKAQAYDIATNIINDLSKEPTVEQIQKLSKKEVIALIAYMQRLGADIHKPSDHKAIPYVKTEEHEEVETETSLQPYTPLELEGRDIYIREGCNNCHSQMVRPLRFETARYGEYSKEGEFDNDHPFLWGSKRTGPDLHREGIGNKNNRPDSWHYRHFKMPSNVSDGSLMPAYSWLIEDELDYSDIAKKISVMRELGVPYPEGYEKVAGDEIKAQAYDIATNIINDLSKEPTVEQIQKLSKKEVIALIAYMQRLGAYIHKPSDHKAIPYVKTEEQEEVETEND